MEKIIPLQTISYLEGWSSQNDDGAKVKISQVLEYGVNIGYTCFCAFVVQTMNQVDVFSVECFVISRRRIVTNVHVVTAGTYVQTTRMGSGTKYRAKVLAFGHDCDLAVLLVDNEDFWKGLKPLRISKNMPLLFQRVQVVGFPQGGDSISVTSGVVSRILSHYYGHSKSPTELPAFQVDATINSGSSGEPVLVGKTGIGIAFEVVKDAQNVGYVIPSPLLLMFLSSIEKEEGICGFCSLGLSTQANENMMMRGYLKMEDGKH